MSGARTWRLVVLLALLVWAPAARADVYWTNSGSDSIGRAYLDGTGVDEGFITVPFLQSFGVAVDANSVYWTDNSLIGRANLDGSGVNQDFITGATNANGIAVDANFVYWTQLGSSSSVAIARAPINNPAAANLTFITKSTAMDMSEPFAVAVNATNVYWADVGANAIEMTGINGGSDTKVIPATSQPKGVALDASHLYWTSQGGDTIGRSDLNGGNAQPNFITGASSPQQVAVEGNFIYWVNMGSNTIGRAPLNDPAAADQSFITGANDPFGLAVDAGAPPANTGAPAIAGVAVAGATLSEVHGAWSGSPTGFSFQWLSCDASGAHCVPIPGATGPTYIERRTDIGSTVRVEETSSNTFGTSTVAISGATGVVQTPGAFLVGVSTAGASASLTFACHGPVACTGRAVLTVHERRRGRSVLAVSARKRPKVTTATVTVGTASVLLAVGQRKTITLRLNASGSGLLSNFYTLPSTLSLPGLGIGARRLTFSYRRIRSPFFFTALFRPAFTTFQSLTVSGLPSGARVTLRCRGAGCPFAQRALRPRHSHASLTPLLARAKLSPGARLQIAITAVNEIGKVLMLTMRSGAAPAQSALCLPPGARNPLACR